MRKALALAVVVAAVAIAVPVLAGGAQRSGKIDRQSFIWTDEAATTSSSDWSDIPGLSGLQPTNCLRGSKRVSALVSLSLEGSAPVGIRVEAEGTVSPDLFVTVMKPGAVTVDLSGLGERAAVSFNFVHGNPAHDHGTTYSVQWRSPTGAEITMHKGTMNVLWDAFDGDKGIGCI